MYSDRWEEPLVFRPSETSDCSKVNTENKGHHDIAGVDPNKPSHKVSQKPDHCANL